MFGRTGLELLKEVAYCDIEHMPPHNDAAIREILDQVRVFHSPSPLLPPSLPPRAVLGSFLSQLRYVAGTLLQISAHYSEWERLTHIQIESGDKAVRMYVSRGEKGHERRPDALPFLPPFLPPSPPSPPSPAPRLKRVHRSTTSPFYGINGCCCSTTRRAWRRSKGAAGSTAYACPAALTASFLPRSRPISTPTMRRYRRTRMRWV